MLQHVKVGWKDLEDKLNEIIDQVNRQAPVKGDGVILNPTDSGTVIQLEPNSDS